MKACFLYCAGEYFDGYITPQKNETVAAVDGGALLTERLGLTPDIIIGDFDSLGHIPSKDNILRYPAEKDDTDTAIACEHFLEKGYDTFYIFGAVGGRPEHTYANLQLLNHLAKCGAQGFIFANNCVFTALSCAALQWSEGYEGYISVFAMSDKARGVSISGLKYHLKDATLTNDRPLGVSNEFISQRAAVSVEDGTLLIMFERKRALELPAYIQINHRKG